MGDFLVSGLLRLPKIGLKHDITLGTLAYNVRDTFSFATLNMSYWNKMKLIDLYKSIFMDNLSQLNYLAKIMRNLN